MTDWPSMLRLTELRGFADVVTGPVCQRIPTLVVMCAASPGTSGAARVWARTRCRDTRLDLAARLSGHSSRSFLVDEHRSDSNALEMREPLRLEIVADDAGLAPASK